jgi:hypothetical protein
MSDRKREIVIVLGDGETWESLNHDITIGIVEWDAQSEDDFPFDSISSAVKYGEDEDVTYQPIVYGSDIIDLAERKINE